MSHHKYLLFIGIAGIISWVAFGLVVNKLDPFESTGLALALFFVSLFFALTCSFTVIGFYFRLWLNKNEIYYNHINVSLRQAVWLSLIALGCLVLQLLGVLNWWSGLLMIGVIVMFEFYFLAKQDNE